jgi:acetyl esterase
VITRPQFKEETAAFLARIGTQEHPIDHDALIADRASAPDPHLAGVPEPVTVRTDVLLPLPGRPIRIRLYRGASELPRPLLLWLHGGAFAGGTLDDIDVTCAGLARRSGFTVVSLDYRLAPENPFPAALPTRTTRWPGSARTAEHSAATGELRRAARAAGATWWPRRV